MPLHRQFAPAQAVLMPSLASAIPAKPATAVLRTSRRDKEPAIDRARLSNRFSLLSLPPCCVGTRASTVDSCAEMSRAATCLRSRRALNLLISPPLIEAWSACKIGTLPSLILQRAAGCNDDVQGNQSALVRVLPPRCQHIRC